MKNICIYFLALFLFSSCSFNKTVFGPTKLPQDLEKISLIDAEIKLSGNSFQPTYFRDGDTLTFDYTIESVVFQSSNGNKLNGWMVKPKNSTPTITLLHYHGNGALMLAHSVYIFPLLKQGYQIFTFDYSGFGFSDGEATQENILMDGLSALDYVKGREDVLGTKLVIYGQSLGGHLGAVVAAQREKDLDGLVIEGGFSSLKDMAALKLGVLGRMLIKQKYSAIESISSYTKPLLVIHSIDDEENPYKLGRKLFEKANNPKSFFEIKKCHICGPKYYSKEISEKIKEMVK